MTQPQSAFRRAPRPLIGWAAVVLMVMCLAFLAVVFFAIGQGLLLTAAKGQGVPDMTGGLAMLIPAMATAWGVVAQWMHTRSAERREETRAGVAPPSPFPPSPPSGPPPDAFDPRPEVNRQ
ncbi:MAG: hypothetical protein ABL932_21730 [Terricaulis sp.]